MPLAEPAARTTGLPGVREGARRRAGGEPTSPRQTPAAPRLARPSASRLPAGAAASCASSPRRTARRRRSTERPEPGIVPRWQSLPGRDARRRHDPVFAPWHALRRARRERSSPRRRRPWPTRSPQARADAAAEPARRRGVRGSRRRRRSREVAERYGKLLRRGRREWQERIGRPAATRCRDADGEALRQVLYGRDAPANVADGRRRHELLRRATHATGCATLQAGGRRSCRPIAPAPRRGRWCWSTRRRRASRASSSAATRQPGRRGAAAVPRGAVAATTRKPFPTAAAGWSWRRRSSTKDNPLTARVMVNRIWMHHFGAGLVRTPSDFGMRSEPPTHPELLDWLAAALRARTAGRIKKLHRLIMLSADLPAGAATTDADDAAGVDPENRLLWRMNRRRLDFEAMRDSLLAVAGELDPTIGGPAGRAHRRAAPTPAHGLRLHRPPEPARACSAPSTSPAPTRHSPQRYDTTVPQQALFMMNSPFVVEQARRAGRARRRRRRRRRGASGALPRWSTAATPTPERDRSWRCAFLDDGRRQAAGRRREHAWQLRLRRVRRGDAAGSRVSRRCPTSPAQAWQGGAAAAPTPKLGWVAAHRRGRPSGQRPAARRRSAAGSAPQRRRRSRSSRHARPRRGPAATASAAWIVSSRAGVLGDWTVHSSQARSRRRRRRGRSTATRSTSSSTVRDDLNCDQFVWAPMIQHATAADAAGSASTGDAAARLPGPPPARASR